MRLFTKAHGVLEIQHVRGVVYFHCDKEEITEHQSITPLRIQGLVTPIPALSVAMIDVRASIPDQRLKPRAEVHRYVQTMLSASYSVDDEHAGYHRIRACTGDHR